MKVKWIDTTKKVEAEEWVEVVELDVWKPDLCQELI
jgi:hypothetical protein